MEAVSPTKRTSRTAIGGEQQEELSPGEQQARRELKARFLKALLRNDAQEVQTILRKTSLDVDTVLEVDDPDMVLASYMKGN